MDSVGNHLPGSNRAIDRYLISVNLDWGEKETPNRNLFGGLRQENMYGRLSGMLELTAPPGIVGDACLRQPDIIGYADET